MWGHLGATPREAPFRGGHFAICCSIVSRARLSPFARLWYECLPGGIGFDEPDIRRIGSNAIKRPPKDNESAIGILFH